MKATRGEKVELGLQSQETVHYGEEVKGGRSLQQLVTSHPQPGTSAMDAC